MKKTLLVAALSLAAHMSFAQKSVRNTGIAQQNIEDLGRSNNGGMVWSFDDRYQGIKGTPYFSDEWMNAELYINDKLFGSIEGKYNVIENKFFYRDSAGKTFMLREDKIARFSLYDKINEVQYTFKKLTSGNLGSKLKDRFFLILREGSEVELLMLPEKVIFKANHKSNYGGNIPYDEIVTKKSYYIIHHQKDVQKVKLSKNNLLKLLSNKHAEVEAFLGREKIDATTEDGWVRVLAHYETL